MAAVEHNIHVPDHVPYQSPIGPGIVAPGQPAAAEADQRRRVAQVGGVEEVAVGILLDRRPHLARVGLLPRVLLLPLHLLLLIRGSHGGDQLYCLPMPNAFRAATMRNLAVSCTRRYVCGGPTPRMRCVACCVALPKSGDGRQQDETLKQVKVGESCFSSDDTCSDGKDGKSDQQTY